MGEFAKAVEHGIDNGFIHWAEEFGAKIAGQRVTTSQIRNIFGSVKRLEMSSDLNLPALLLLKPRIAYACSRDSKNQGLKALGDILIAAIDAVDKAEDKTEQFQRFRRFCQGFEAILAYHRANNGK